MFNNPVRAQPVRIINSFAHEYMSALSSILNLSALGHIFSSVLFLWRV